MTEAADPSRPTWTDVKKRLDAIGFRPSRRFGQNFLLDENMVRRIATDAEIEAGDFVLEVGAGCGFLSTFLAATGARLVTVEIDDRLFEVASSVLEPWPDAKVVHGDVLAGKHRLNPEVAALLPESGPWQLVGNLPYSIASPLFVVLSRLPNPPRTMTALVQAEVADRVGARPGTSDWGPLTVRLQALYRAKTLRRVPPQLFWPRPKVDSAVTRLERLSAEEGGELGDERLEHLDALVALLFGQRRKRVVGLLARSVGERTLVEGWAERLGIELEARAGDLSVAQLLELADAVAETGRPLG